MNNIKTWQERQFEHFSAEIFSMKDDSEFMELEIADLRAALASQASKGAGENKTSNNLAKVPRFMWSPNGMLPIVTFAGSWLKYDDIVSELTAQAQPVDSQKVDFLKHLEGAADAVKDWPDWKKNIWPENTLPPKKQPVEVVFLAELLARIHRDGGQHQAAVGTEQAFRDADAIVVKWLAGEAQPVADAAPRRFNWTRDGMEQAADGAYCYASETKSPADAAPVDSKLVERLTHERDALATAISDAAKKAGIWNGEVALTGPHLIMFANDLAECAITAQGDAPVAVQLRPGVVNYQWPAQQTIINGKVIGTIIHDSIDDRSMLISSARAAALDDAAKVCESKLQYPGDDAGVDTALHEAISAIRGLAAKPAD